MKQLIAAALLWVGIGIADAGEMTGYDIWRAYAPITKQGYIMGAIDYFVFSVVGNDVYTIANARGLRACIIEDGLTAPDWVHIVDEYYLSHPELRPARASLVVYQAAAALCIDSINSAREHYGLEALSPPASSIQGSR